MRLQRLAAIALSTALPLALALTFAASCSRQASTPADAGSPPDGSAEDAGDAADATDATDATDADATDAAAEPPLPSWSAEPFPETRSPMPKKEEWASAPLVAIDREIPERMLRHILGGCTTRRLREWVQIRCEQSSGMLLLGGNADGIALMRDHAAIFPVRRGDRRVIEMATVDTSFRETGRAVNRLLFSSTPGFVISEQWVAGDERPMIIASDHERR